MKKMPPVKNMITKRLHSKLELNNYSFLSRDKATLCVTREADAILSAL